MFKKFFSNDVLKILIAILLVGFGAGVVGGLVVGNLYLSRLSVSSSGITITRPKISNELDQKFQEAMLNIAPSLVGIYSVKSKTGNILNQIYLPSELEGQGVVISSDGWILTSQAVVANAPAEKKYQIMTREGKIYSPVKKLEDPATNLVFLKIEANNLTASKFGAIDQTAAGDSVLLSDFSGRHKLTKIEKLDWESISKSRSLVKSSERFLKRILISTEFDKAFLGGPVVNSEGEVIGILDNSGARTAVPADYFKPVIARVLKEGRIIRPYLGVNYLDLSRARGVEFQNTAVRNGALIYGNSSLAIRAVEPKSPASLAGLKEGDVVLRVDKENVDKKNDLTELVQEYQPGAKIELTVLREGKEISLKVELGGVKN